MAEHTEAPGGPPRRDSTFDTQSTLNASLSSVSPSLAASSEVPQGRNRRRSNTIIGENPFETPISSQDVEIASLIRTIKHQYEADEKNHTVRKAQVSHQPGAPVDHLTNLFTEESSTPFPAFDPSVFVEQSGVETTAKGADIKNLPTTKRYLATSPTTLRKALGLQDLDYEADTESTRSRRPLPDLPQGTRRRSSYYKYIPNTQGGQFPPPSPHPPSGAFGQLPPIKRVQTYRSLANLQEVQLRDQKLTIERHWRRQELQSKIATGQKMSYQGYESSGAGSSNPRQAPPSPSQGMNMNHNNGMNGMAMNPGMIGYPTPAGHQADLNFIMSQVEELSRILRANEAATGNILDKVGQVQEKAKRLNLNNDEILTLAADTLAEDTKNLETELAAMTKRLEKAERDRDANWKLVMHGCAVLADVRDKMHEFKARHESETLAWHKSYRNQLAFEREQNLGLNNQTNNMRAAACRANDHMRGLRRHLSDDPELHELRVQVHQYRKERRFYKRMAFKLMPEDDSEFSDDDDLRDPKLQRIRAAKEAKDREEEEGEGNGAADGQIA